MAKKMCEFGVQPYCTGNCEYTKTCDSTAIAAASEIPAEVMDVVEKTGIAKFGYSVRVIARRLLPFGN